MKIKPIQPDDEISLLCMRADRPPGGSPPLVCEKRKCGTCDEDVWVSVGTVDSVFRVPNAGIEIICNVCAVPNKDDEIQVTPESFGEGMRHS